MYAVQRNFYMDDLLALKPTSDEATGLAKYLIGILATGRFRLKKWMPNRREMRTAIPSSEVACDIIHLDRNELPQKRALGVKWSREQDLLSLGTVESELPNTKTNIESHKQRVRPLRACRSLCDKGKTNLSKALETPD